MTTNEILKTLESLGTEQTKKVLTRHGAKEPFYGVKIEDLRKIQKKIKINNTLAKELYETGNSDAMYLAGLIADPGAMTKTDLNNWAKKAYWYLISEYTVPGVASKSKHGKALALKWIDSPKEKIASVGWATLAAILSPKCDENIDVELVKELIERIRENLQTSQDRVRYTMNGFIIASGVYVPSLTKTAISAAKDIGKVNVNMGETACKVPEATEYIKKSLARTKKK